MHLVPPHKIKGGVQLFLQATAHVPDVYQTGLCHTAMSMGSLDLFEGQWALSGTLCSAAPLVALVLSL